MGQALFNMDEDDQKEEKEEDEEEEVTDEQALKGLDNGLNLEAARIHDGTQLSLSITEWTVEVITDGVVGGTNTYVISSTQTSSKPQFGEETLEELEERLKGEQEAFLECKTEEAEEFAERMKNVDDDGPEEGQLHWAPRL